MVQVYLNTSALAVTDWRTGDGNDKEFYTWLGRYVFTIPSYLADISLGKM